MTNTILTLIGNLTADPELRFTPGGKAVINFTLACTPRVFKDGEWTEGDTLFMRCSYWGQPAENMSESIRRGDRLIVHGKLRPNFYTTRDGEEKKSIELVCEEVGASMQFKTVNINRAVRETIS